MSQLRKIFVLLSVVHDGSDREVGHLDAGLRRRRFGRRRRLRRHWRRSRRDDVRGSNLVTSGSGSVERQPHRRWHHRDVWRDPFSVFLIWTLISFKSIVYCRSQANKAHVHLIVGWSLGFPEFYHNLKIHF